MGLSIVKVTIPVCTLLMFALRGLHPVPLNTYNDNKDSILLCSILQVSIGRDLM